MLRYYILTQFFLYFPVESADCDIIVDRHQDMTLCVDQDDEIIITPDTNHNHQPLLSNDNCDAKLPFAENRCPVPVEDTKDSSTVKNKQYLRVCFYHEYYRYYYNTCAQNFIVTCFAMLLVTLDTLYISDYSLFMYNKHFDIVVI